jgi:hypothetical protein
MIQAIRETNFNAFIETKANMIGNQGTARTRHLFKFINDLDEAVFYAYPLLENIYPRYTAMPFIYNLTPDMYNGQVNLIPAGYFKYEVYEVSWGAGVDVFVALGSAPATETDVLPVSPANGVIEGLVAIGKLYLSEKEGSEEVQYVQSAKRVQTLTIQSGGSGYATAPTITIEAPPTYGGGHQATATCTILAGVVNTVTITYAGSGYTTNPVVTLTGGTPVTEGTITASIEQTNYIYYGQ